jgi:hypothetical protein
MAVTIYRSTDASAPSALPASFSIATILYTCLVTGYGAKANSGWTRPYTSAGLSVFKQPTGSSGFYLRVDESTVASSALLRGYESMTGVSTGVRPFPTVAQDTQGYAIGKGTADSSAMSWVLICNGPAFWLFIKPRSTNIGAPFDYAIPFFFGDINSYKSGDLYKCMIHGPAYNLESGFLPDTYYNSTGQTQTVTLAASMGAGSVANTISRSYTGAIAPVYTQLHSDYIRTNGQYNSGGTLVFPNSADGGIYISRIYISEWNGTQGILRGSLPGIWVLNHNTSLFNIGDTFNGSGELAGKTFEFFRCGSQTAYYPGVIAMEVSNTW